MIDDDKLTAVKDRQAPYCGVCLDEAADKRRALARDLRFVSVVLACAALLLVATAVYLAMCV